MQRCAAMCGDAPNAPVSRGGIQLASAAFLKCASRMRREKDMQRMHQPGHRPLDVLWQHQRHHGHLPGLASNVKLGQLGTFQDLEFIHFSSRCALQARCASCSAVLSPSSARYFRTFSSIRSGSTNHHETRDDTRCHRLNFHGSTR